MHPARTSSRARRFHGQLILGQREKGSNGRLLQLLVRPVACHGIHDRPHTTVLKGKESCPQASDDEDALRDEVGLESKPETSVRMLSMLALFCLPVCPVSVLEPVPGAVNPNEKKALVHFLKSLTEQQLTKALTANLAPDQQKRDWEALKAQEPAAHACA